MERGGRKKGRKKNMLKINEKKGKKIVGKKRVDRPG